jgi:hypothetical protein
MALNPSGPTLLARQADELPRHGPAFPAPATLPATPWAELVPVMAVAALAALGATIWSASTHSLTLYGDARAHLNVARHVTDGLRVGLAQLGSVWLPLPHLLLVPLVAWAPLWHSAAAGAIVSGLAFVYSSVRVYTLVAELTDSRIGAWIGFAVFAANLNMLYVQTTALTEPVLIAFVIGAVYHLARWMRLLSLRELVWAGLLTFCATLSRYEGWALLVAGVGAVLLWSVLSDFRKHAPEANVVVYVVVGFYGIALWFLYNLTIFHNPLYFLNSAYSAQVINGAQAKFGLLGTKGSLRLSTLTYGWDMVDVVSRVVLGAAALCAVIVLVLRHRERRRTGFVLTLLAAPVVFEVLTLFAGQITIRVPQLYPHGTWNVRYGLMVLPFCAVAIGVAAGRWRLLAGALSLVVVMSTVVAAFGTPITLADGRSGTSSAAAGKPELAARYLQDHYRGGEVLADDSAASPFMFAADLDLKQFVSPGEHPFWDRALVAPARHVEWVVAFPRDAVTEDLQAHPDRFDRFKLVETDGDIHLYKRTGARR